MTQQVTIHPAESAAAAVSAPPPSSVLARALAGLECVLLFVVIPGVYWLGLVNPPLIPAIIGMALVCLGLLLMDRTFDRRLLWGGALPGAAGEGHGLRALGRHLREPLLRFLILGTGMTIATAALVPEKFLVLVREQPRVWAAIMVLYPVFSVYPQEVIFRVFMFHRYRSLFGEGWGMILVTAALFGWVHILFKADPVLSIGLSAVGGVLFGMTYRKSRSVLAASIEHALYGDLIYTIGLGAYFYTGGTGG